MMADITVSMPDGSSIAFPEGTPQEKILEVVRRAGRPRQSDPAGTAEMNQKALQAMAQGVVDENPVASRVFKFDQGLPFVGQWADEAAGLIGGDGARDYVRTVQNAMDVARPKESMAWQLGGGIAGTLAAARMLGPTALAVAPSSLGMQTVVGLTAGAGAGALEGAVSGAGAANEGDRMAGAGKGALIGGAVGGAVGAVAPAAARGAATAYSYLKGQAVPQIAKALGISNEAARAVKAALDGDDLGRAAANIQRGGPDAMLLESGPATQALGDAAAQSGGAAARIMREGVDQRAQGGAKAFNQALDSAFSSGGALRAKPDLGNAYMKAYSTPIDYSSQAGRNIESLVRRVPQSEFARARRLIEMDPSIPDNIKRQFLVSIQPDGTISQETLPSMLELDYVTRALNDVAKAGDGKGALGGSTNEGRIYGNLSKAIRGQMKKAVPDYGKALDAASTEIGIREADEFGTTMLRQSVTRREVVERLAQAPRVEREAAKAAARQAIDDQIANTRRIMTRPGTDVGEAIKGIKDLSSRASRDKLAVLLGRKEADALIGSLDEAATAFEIQAAMAQNSKTAARQAIQGSVDASAEPGAVGRLLAGEPLGATKRFAQIFTGRTPEAQEAIRAGIYEDIATALTQIKGPNAQRALSLVQRAMAGQPLTDAQAERIGRLVSRTLVVGGYPTGTQTIQRLTR